MDEKIKVIKKLDELETDYKKGIKLIDGTIDEALQEKTHFQRGIEELGDYVSYLFQKQEYRDSLDIRQAYQMLEHAQEDGFMVVKNTRQKLEDEQEDLSAQYQKRRNFYEEDLTLLKRKETIK
ncbi:hypothetical protein ACWOFR_00870 [Carnobacterium gallinarum]|uniref:hypothetical protein n=1 Tax=Carnobacterium gallinarum TaxID=2749 RepID=UPI00054EE264|nr:hypothetical protein [Carnobacterium gallinarum]